MACKNKSLTSLINFEKLKEEHMPLLLQWLEAPHVKAWWDQDIKWTIDLIREKFHPYCQGYKLDNGVAKPLYAFIITFGACPIGYIQLYNAYDFSCEQGRVLENLPVNLASFDLYLGEVDFVGKGLGSLILSRFLDCHIWPSFEACFVEVDSANKAALRTYEKVGFKRVIDIEEEKIVWMVLERNRLKEACF